SSRFLASHLLLAERAETIAHYIALGATRAACSAVASDGVETHEIAIGAGEHDLRHIEHRRFARSVLTENADVAADLDVLNIHQLPIDHCAMWKFHHRSVCPLASAAPLASSCFK